MHNLAHQPGRDGASGSAPGCACGGDALAPTTGGETWFSEHLHPEYRQPLARAESLMPADYRERDAAGRRQVQEATYAPEPGWVSDVVDWEDRIVPGGDGQPLRLRVYRPRQPAAGPHPAVVCVHGGGMWAGTLESEHATFAAICRDHGAVCVSVDYRLAPEHPFPAGLTDVDAALRWTVSHADELDVDAERVALYGGSAGGGLVLGAALYARDHDGPALCFVQAIYPMIDPRSVTASSYQVQRRGTGAWTRQDNIEAWQWYLAGAEPSIYAAPALADVEELSGLPSTYIDVGELDLFRDEDLSLAARLSAAGVPTELHLLPGVFHGAENVVPAAAPSQWLWNARREAMARHLHPRP